MTRPDRHNEIELNWLASGSLTYLLGGRRTTLSAGKLGLFWAAIPHQIVDFCMEAPYFVVTIPLAEFLRAGVCRELANRALQGELLVDNVFDGEDEARFARWEVDLKSQTQAFERAAELEVRARLLRMSARITSVVTPPSPLGLSRADQLACFIAMNYQQPLTSESIATANKVHPNYAMSLFKKTFGTTMTAFVVQHRLSHAQRLLVTTDQTVLNVALEAGFQSLSRFNEAFKQACGCSPRDYRKLHRNKEHQSSPNSD